MSQRCVDTSSMSLPTGCLKRMPTEETPTNNTQKKGLKTNPTEDPKRAIIQGVYKKCTGAYGYLLAALPNPKSNTQSSGSTKVAAFGSVGTSASSTTGADSSTQDSTSRRRQCRRNSSLNYNYRCVMCKKKNATVICFICQNTFCDIRNPANDEGTAYDLGMVHGKEIFIQRSCAHLWHEESMLSHIEVVNHDIAKSKRQKREGSFETTSGSFNPVNLDLQTTIQPGDPSHINRSGDGS